MSLKETDVRMWTALNWFRVGFSESCLVNMVMKFRGPEKERNFLIR